MDRTVAWDFRQLPLLTAGLLTLAGAAHAEAPRPAMLQVPPLFPGGLTPPPGAPLESARSAQTRAELEQAEREDSGRGLEFLWLNLETGADYLSLQALSGNALVDGSFIGDSGTGLLIGGSAGVRLIFLSAGARVRQSRFKDWNLLTLGGQVGLHWPLGALEPSAHLEVAYASLSIPEKSGDAGSVPALAARGVSVQTGAALDYYLNPLLSLGAQADVETLFLGRDGLRSADTSLPGAPSSPYAGNESSIGLGGSVVARIGFHY